MELTCANFSSVRGEEELDEEVELLGVDGDCKENTKYHLLKRSYGQTKRSYGSPQYRSRRQGGRAQCQHLLLYSQAGRMG